MATAQLYWHLAPKPEVEKNPSTSPLKKKYIFNHTFTGTKQNLYVTVCNRAPHRDYLHLVCQIQVVSKALVRLLRSHNEVQAIVLHSIASMTIKVFENLYFEGWSGQVLQKRKKGNGSADMKGKLGEEVAFATE